MGWNSDSFRLSEFFRNTPNIHTDSQSKAFICAISSSNSTAQTRNHLIHKHYD